MSYQVLALKYRPQTFDEVIGQAHVTQTLSNAISSDRVAHAILLTGPRGTGKTTIARILAKAMNCEKGPAATPCNQCRICKDIIEGGCTDVFEIDGASNNSVEQIRDLRENVAYMPTSAPFKIYIIDEVHMLSSAAFNALLKTLEEPPAHVMFIFATTEVHKIPATILSRCQRHDLGRIPFNLITDHLKTLAQKEGFEVDKKAVELVVKEADGSIRDALSLFDRILSASPEKSVEYENTVRLLGVLDRKILQDLCLALIEKNGKQMIELIETASDTGQDLKKFYGRIIQYFRDLNVIKLCGIETAAINLSDHEKNQLFSICKNLPAGFLNAVLKALLNNEPMVLYSSHIRTAIEMVLLKLLDMNQDAQVDKIIANLDTLAKQIQTSPHPVLPQESEGPVPGDIARPSPGRSQNRMQQESGQKKNWKTFLKKIEQEHPFTTALLTKGQTDDRDKKKIIVELFDCSSFDLKRIKQDEPQLQQICHDFLEKDLKIVVVSEKNRLKQQQEEKKELKARHAAYTHPLVVKAQKMFDGEIINK